MMDGGWKHLVSPFRRKKFWKFICFVLLEVTYGKKGHKLWIEIKYILVGRHLLKYKEMFVGTPI